MRHFRDLIVLFLLGCAWDLHASSLVEGSQVAQDVSRRVVKAWEKAGYEAQAMIVRIPRDRFGPCGSLAWELDETHLSLNRVGHTRIPIRILKNGRFSEVSEVGLYVTLKSTVAVAALPLKRLSTLKEPDVIWQEQWVDTRPQDWLINASQINGKRLRRDIPSGSRIAMNALEIDPLVRRGEVVDIVSVQGPIRLTFRGVAENDGQLQDVIRVKSLDTGHILLAYVAGNKALELR